MFGISPRVSGYSLQMMGNRTIGLQFDGVVIRSHFRVAIRAKIGRSLRFITWPGREFVDCSAVKLLLVNSPVDFFGESHWRESLFIAVA